jgi:DNA-directed RNA polymerase subunit RPC12/RpoP
VRSAVEELVDIACRNCGWRDSRSRVILDRDRSVACPRCFSLHSIETAEAAAEGTAPFGDFSDDEEEPD